MPVPVVSPALTVGVLFVPIAKSDATASDTVTAASPPFSPMAESDRARATVGIGSSSSMTPLTEKDS